MPLWIIKDSQHAVHANSDDFIGPLQSLSFFVPVNWNNNSCSRSSLGHRTSDISPPFSSPFSVCVCVSSMSCCLFCCLRTLFQPTPTNLHVCVCVCLSTLSESVRNGAYVQCKSFKSHTLIKRHSDTPLDWPASVEECVAFAVWHVSIVLTYTIGN